MTTRSLRRILVALPFLITPAWAIAQNQPPPTPAPPRPRAELEGQGALRAVSPTGQDRGQCPLRHTDVAIEVSGFVARARVTQTFENRFAERIEAIYTFPLPEDAAVRDFEMRIGDRVIRGDIQRREDARENYEAARQRGETASLLEQERTNIFTQSVANLEPGKAVQVTIEYVDVLDYERGVYSMAFPMVVGPRYNPGLPTGQQGTGFSADTTDVPDASRITPMPAIGMRAGHDISVSVTVDAGVPIHLVRSPSHGIEQTVAGTTARVNLAPADRIPNKDFVLEMEVSPATVASGLLSTRPDGDPGTATLVLHPTARPVPADVRPRELVFVLDTSGSMSGEPMDKSKALMTRMLATLRPGDAFNVMTFDDAVSTLSVDPLPATPENIARGHAFVTQMDASGGTEMMNGIRAAMRMAHDPRRLKIVVFLTDGYVGNDQEIIAEVGRTRGEARLFSFGIGSSVNRFLLDGMASRGRGAVQYVLLGSTEGDVVERFRQRLDAPVLTDLELDWGGLAVTDVSPATLPDLFAGQPLVVHARFTQAGRGTIRLRGKLGSRRFEQRLEAVLPDREPRNVALESVWARRQVDDVMAQIETQGETDVLKERVVSLGLAYRLMTRYTSFLAVEVRTEPVAGGPPRQVAVPVELPAGVSAEGIFGPAVSLSLARFQPGDPEVRIDAPSGARAVTVVFPFGETRAAEFEPRLGRWTSRFLVPRGTPDGVYEILVIVTHADGAVERWATAYTVDSSAPEVDVAIEGDAVAGQTVTLRATQRITSAELELLPGARARLRRGTLRAELLTDAARVIVETPDGQVLPLSETSPGRFEARWTVRASTGVQRLRVVSVDLAGNRREGFVPLAGP